MDIGERIRMIVAQKARNQKTFASMMGWTPSYLSKLVTEQQGMGLTPIMQLLEKFPDIDARWLLFGTGYMFGSIENEIRKRMERLLDIEQYIPVMTEEEQRNYIDIVQGKSLFNFYDEDIQRWKTLLKERTTTKEEIIKKAMNESIRSI